MLAVRSVSSLSTTTATLGGVSLTVELATTSAAQQLGLGGRTNLPANHAMLFIFKTPGYYGFWMKDTLIPLDMFWLDGSSTVVSFKEDIQPDTYPEVFYPEVPARYVLETNAGFAVAHGIATGTSFILKNSPSVSR